MLERSVGDKGVLVTQLTIRLSLVDGAQYILVAHALSEIKRLTTQRDFGYDSATIDVQIFECCRSGVGTAPIPLLSAILVPFRLDFVDDQDFVIGSVLFTCYPQFIESIDRLI